jgi:hypothetical protein
MGTVYKRWVSAVLILFGCAAAASAQTWIGGGADSNWSTAGNWSGGIVPTNNGTADVMMVGPGNLNSIVDAPWNIHSLSFADGAPAFSVSGSNLTIGEIHNPASASQSISNNLFANASLLLDSGGSSRTRISGNISAANVIINGAIDIDPGSGNTVTVAGSVKVNTELKINSGTVNFGNNIISGQKPSTVAGINEYFASGAFYEGPIAGRPNSYNVPDSIQLEPRRANQAPGNINGNPPGQGGNPPGWTENSTYIYSGQILVPDNGAPFDGIGHVAFYMRFAESVSLKIDGVTRMRDTTGNNATSSGDIQLTPGWHDIEMRFGAGTGEVGPNTGWASAPPNQFADETFAAFGYQTDASLGFDSDSSFNGAANFNCTTDLGRYFAPRDNGSLNMFRVATGNESGVVNVAAGATVTAGGVIDLVGMNMAGNATVNLSNTATHTGSVNTLSAGGSAGEVNTITLGANNTLNVQGMKVAGGTIFNKNGAGTLRIAQLPGVPTAAFLNAHDFADGSEIHINAGNMIINSLGLSGTGAVIVGAGATLGGTGSITGAVTVSASGRIAPGDGIGTLRVGALSLHNSVLMLEGGANGLDQIRVNPDEMADRFSLSGNNIINLTDVGGLSWGDYVIIDQNNLTPVANAASFFSIGNHPAGVFPSIFVDENNDIVLHMVGCLGCFSQWNVDADGSWGVAANWGFSLGVPDSPSAIANLLGVITAPRTVTLDGNRTVQDINFDNANKYTIALGTGGTLTVNAGTISVTSGSHEISAGLRFSGAVTKTGPGTVTISGTQSHSIGSSLTVSGGTVNLNSNAGGGTAATSPLALSITGSSARVKTGANQDLRELTVAFGNSGTQTLDLASPVGAGEFHQINVYSANLAAAKTALYNALVHANEAGAPDPLDGITDSGLHSGMKLGLALLGDHVTIRPVRVGDLNLDGRVTVADFIDLASNFNTIGTATWQEGDLNYDRNVTLSDFIDLASNFNGAYNGESWPISEAEAALLNEFAAAHGVAIPEPNTFTVMLITVGALSRRGQRGATALKRA